MGETSPRKEDQVRANYNRQARRAGLCVKVHSPREPELANQLSESMLTPRGDGLAQVAARIAEELELSADAIDELLFGQMSSRSLPQA